MKDRHISTSSLFDILT